jgi:hypothetical protein
MKAAKEGDKLLLTQLLKLDEKDILHELRRLAWFAIPEAAVRGHVSTVELLLRHDGTSKCENIMHGTIRDM